MQSTLAYDFGDLFTTVLLAIRYGDRWFYASLSDVTAPRV